MAEPSPPSAPPKLPTPPLTGQCQCGAVRYTITAHPIALYACHCTECQRQTGSVHSLGLFVPSSGVVVSPQSKANLRETTRVADSGATRKGAFCAHCGVRLWHWKFGDDALTSVRGGTLDQKVDLRAATHIWTRSAIRGTVIPEGVESFEKEPPE